MKRYLLAPVVAGTVAMAVVGSTGRAAVPTERECGAASTQAEELRSAGDLSGARARLALCLSTGCSRSLRESCTRQMAAIDAAIPGVVLEAKDETSNNVGDVRVTMDGAPVVDRLDGTPILVNPGEHRLSLEAPGFRRTETTFVAREGQKKLRVVVYLDSERSLAAGQLLASGGTGAPGQDGGPGFFGGRRRKIALTLGCAGIAGVAVGTIWAIMSKVTYDHALGSECGGDVNHCSSQGIADGRTAHSQANVATVGFVAAGALLAAGAAVYFMGPRQTGVAVAPAANGGGALAVVGKW